MVAKMEAKKLEERLCYTTSNKLLIPQDIRM